jgi:G3E family GTPase
MMRKINIEIVTGFIGAGKTTFINALLSSTLVEGERVLILQGELGEKSIDDKYLNSGQINVENMISIDKIREYKPHRVIIEHNGTAPLQELLDILNQAEMRKIYRISTVYNIIDVETFELYLSNMEALILPCIYSSNLILMNNLENIKKEEQIKIKKKLEELNSYAIIMGIKDITYLEEELWEANIFQRKIFKKVHIALKNYFSGEEKKDFGK